MNSTTKIVLRIGFLVALVYVLAEVFGAVEGSTVRKGCHKRGRMPGDALLPAAPWADTGMLSHFMPSSGDTPQTGIQSRLP